MLHILTLHWNKKDTIKKLYESLLPALKDLEWQWLIKDNASTDGSAEEIKSWNDDNVKLIEYKHNKDNYSQGMNFLFKESSAKNDDFIMTLNNDILFKDDSSIKNMINLFKYKGVGLVGAKLNFSGTKKIQHCGVLFHQHNGLPFHFRGNCDEEERDSQNRSFPIVTGAVSLTTADIFNNNMFNEKYHWSFDDCDFSMGVRHNLNKDVVCCGETNIEHEESSSLKKNPVNKMFMDHNSRLFLQTWHKKIDISLPKKYEDPRYNLFKVSK